MKRFRGGGGGGGGGGRLVSGVKTAGTGRMGMAVSVGRLFQSTIVRGKEKLR